MTEISLCLSLALSMYSYAGNRDTPPNMTNRSTFDVRSTNRYQLLCMLYISIENNDKWTSDNFLLIFNEKKVRNSIFKLRAEVRSILLKTYIECDTKNRKIGTRLLFIMLIVNWCICMSLFEGFHSLRHIINWIRIRILSKYLAWISNVYPDKFQSS